MMATSDESMRKLIRDTIRDVGVQDKIMAAVKGGDGVQDAGNDAAAALDAADGGAGFAEDRLMAMLLEHGLVDHVRSLCADALAQVTPAPPSRPTKAKRKRLRRHIDLTVVEGKAFIGSSPPKSRLGLDDGSEGSEDGDGDDDGGSSSSTNGGGGGSAARAGAASSCGGDVFVLHIHFRKQRFVSRAVPCVEEPMFNETFPLELPKDFQSVAALADPIHIVLSRTTPAGVSTPVGSHMLSWQRMVLGSSGPKPVLKTFEMDGVGAAASMPVGALSVRVGLRPLLAESTEPLLLQLDAARAVTAQHDNLFLAHARQWWQDYLGIRASHAARLVKLFAADEAGRSRPICKTICPLPAGRHLDTPQQAARFVSLLPHRSTLAVGTPSSTSDGGVHEEQWCNLHTILCKGGGGPQDHAILLCSLLLGFGADAYVCIGTRAGPRGAAAVAAAVAAGGAGGAGLSAAHVWVTTFGHGGAVTFWESTTGEQWVHSRWDQPADTTGMTERTHRYRTIGCAFNHTSFYANVQASDKLGECSMDLANEYAWKALSSDVISTVTPLAGCVAPPLVPNRAEVHLLAEALEAELQVLAGERREEAGLGVAWNDGLSQVLNPFLAAYELEKANGVAASNEEHQHNVRMAIPKGHTFKAFPIEFSHFNARSIISACSKDPSCAEILDATGDHVVHGVRARVFAYPENTFAVWVMFAVTFRSIL